MIASALSCVNAPCRSLAFAFDVQITGRVRSERSSSRSKSSSSAVAGSRPLPMSSSRRIFALYACLILVLAVVCVFIKDFLLYFHLIFLNGIFNHLNAVSYLSHYWNCHRVAESLVTGTVWALGGWLLTPRNGCVVVRETLESFALYWGDSADSHACGVNSGDLLGDFA